MTQPPIIEVLHLTKRYRGADRDAVEDVSFVVEPGQFFALLGPNGAGKTTTISVLTTSWPKRATCASRSASSSSTRAST